MIRLALSVVSSVLPSAMRIFVLRLVGARIGRGCRIGMFTIINAKKIILGDHVQIARFNLIHRLACFEMCTGSRMNGFNWITGANSGSMFVGKNSAITRLHFFEASGNIEIGDNSIIAGRCSHFFTHGLSSTNLDDVRPIRIGSWCYVGSSSRFVPGAEIARGTFVGLGSVVTKTHTEEFVLLAGCPATLKRMLAPSDPYFDRQFLPHDHHPDGYQG